MCNTTTTGAVGPAGLGFVFCGVLMVFWGVFCALLLLSFFLRARARKEIGFFRRGNEQNREIPLWPLHATATKKTGISLWGGRIKVSGAHRHPALGARGVVCIAEAARIARWLLRCLRLSDDCFGRNSLLGLGTFVSSRREARHLFGVASSPSSSSSSLGVVVVVRLSPGVACRFRIRPSASSSPLA